MDDLIDRAPPLEAKRPYAAPAFQSGTAFERLALACTGIDDMDMSKMCNVNQDKATQQCITCNGS